MSRSCLRCGISIVGRRSHAKWCSNACKVAACRERLDLVREPPPPRGPGTSTCIECGTGFLTHHLNVRYCSAECREGARKNREQRRYLQRRDAAHAELEWRCVVCGSSLMGKRAHAKTCGTEPCRGEYRKRRNGVRSCESCGADFTSQSKKSRYCSQKCAHVPQRFHDYASESERLTMQGQRKRARRKAAYVEDVVPSVVFDRDGWVCQLCHEPVRQDLHHLDRWAPTLDHIVPLDAGGPHCYSNVQLAHRSCNSSKGAKFQGQLPLPI